MANEETTPGLTPLQEGEQGDPAPSGYFGTGSIYKPGGTYEKTQEAMYGGVQTQADIAKAASAAPGAILAAAQKQTGVIKEAHRNALVAARQALAQRAMQGMRRGRTTAGNIQAAGTLGKEAAQTYSTMASQQAQEVAGVEQAAAKEAAGLEVLAAQAWDEANTAAQNYWAGMSTMPQSASGKFQADLNAALTSISNAAGVDADGTIGGFNSAWNQADSYMGALDPMVSDHVVAAEHMIIELLNAAPSDIGVPTPYIKHVMPQLFQAFGLQGAMDVLASLVHRMSEGMTGISGTGETTEVPMTPQNWEVMVKYMIENGVMPHQVPGWIFDPVANTWVLGG